jgi:endonuclease/exonuclease/phosphatase family metal-dependent hydrolase
MKALRSAPALAILITIALLVISLVAVVAHYPFGHEGAVAAVLAALLMLFVLGPRLKPGGLSLVRRAQKPAVVLLTCWLGLIGWSKVARGGPMPPPKTNPADVRVVTWNVHCGQEGGPLWKRFNWSGRKHPFQVALQGANPDILCVQEAMPEQVAFLEGVLPAHDRVGVGRDRGPSGESCAIYFNRDRFEPIGGDTFWLEEPTDVPGSGSPLDIKRICTWVRLRDRTTGRTLRVYNLHSYLTEGARQRASRLAIERITAGDPADAVIVCGDFNAPPGALSRRAFVGAGLTDSAELAGKGVGERTYHYWGIPLRRLDGILVSPGWRVANHRVLDVKPDNTFPSDHFGVLADLAFSPDGTEGSFPRQ